MEELENIPDKNIPHIKSKYHKAFIDEYLQTFPRSIKNAYKKVYGENTKDKTAIVSGSRVLNRIDVQEYFRYMEAKSNIKDDKLNELSVQYVKDRLKAFSKAKITDFFEFKGKGLNRKMYIKDLATLPDELVICIQKIKQTKLGIEIELVDKLTSITNIGRHFGMFTDNIQKKISVVDLIKDNL